MQLSRMPCQQLAQVRAYSCAFYSFPCIYHANIIGTIYRSYCKKNTLVPLCWIYVHWSCVHVCFYTCVVSYSITLVWCLIILAGLFSSCMHTAKDAPLDVDTLFGGVVAGVLSVVLFEACVLGVVKWRRRMKEPAASNEKEGVRLLLTSNIIILCFRNGIAYLCNGLLCCSTETQLMTVWTLLMSLLPWR